MSVTEEEVASRFPIHWLVWNNNHEELKIALEAKKFSDAQLEAKDTRGRTPLLLAVTLAHVEAVRHLIKAGADVNCEKDGWTAVQEATATGNSELLSLVLSRRDYVRQVVRSSGVPELLHRLSLAPDFYVEMKWEFTSWVPLVSRVCPFDTYKVYKRGGNVRVDTTLVGFENNRWQRGDRTYIFRGQGRTATMVELDHEAGTCWKEFLEASEWDSVTWPAPAERLLKQRLAAPLAINYLDTDKISFERNKSGIWGWRQDKTEPVNGYECKVFSAHNVQLVSRTRAEHLPRGAPAPAPPAPLAGLLALAEPAPQEEPEIRSSSAEDVRPVAWEQYFSDEPLERDVGRPRVMATKVQKFKATLWLCEDYPLQLQEQIMPILDLMAAMSSPHFAKLKDFIQMQLPAGFPVKIEIPLFHVLNARITFGNIFATETPVPHVEPVVTDGLACVLDDAVFTAGSGYRDAARVHPDDEEEGLLQYAINQSLMQPGAKPDQEVDVWEALRGEPPRDPVLDDDEQQLQMAIEESLSTLALSEGAGLAAALAQSAREHEAAERAASRERAALDEALRRSLLPDWLVRFYYCLFLKKLD